MTTDNPQNSTKDSTQNPTKKFIKRLKIVVTQQEIDEAKAAKADGCMIAKALKRDHPNFKNIWVDKFKVRCTDPDLNCIYTFDMQPRGRVMLLLWDSGEKVRPFDLWLRKPVVRERVLIKGVRSPKHGQQHAIDSHGPVLRPKTKKQRSITGRDRMFGQKVWTDELAQLRKDFGIETPVPTA